MFGNKEILCNSEICIYTTRNLKCHINGNYCAKRKNIEISADQI